MTTESSSTKADILEKAISLFAASGYSAVSMRQIAKAVGITAASLYHHFPDKQTLYIQAIQQAFVSREFMLSARARIGLVKTRPNQKIRNEISIMAPAVTESIMSMFL